MKTALTIAGSDCSGGAGIQADIKTMSAIGVFGMSVIVSVVAENTSRVISIEDVSPKVIADQIDAVFEDIQVDAVKVGMLSTPACMEAVAQKLNQYKPAHVVIDPVMYAKNGCPLMQEDAIDTLIRTVVPLATLLTPNIPEAEKIAGMAIRSVEDMQQAARKIAAMGAEKAVLVEGGHAQQAMPRIFCLTAPHSTLIPKSASRPKTPTAQAAPCPAPSPRIWPWERAWQVRWKRQRTM